MKYQKYLFLNSNTQINIHVCHLCFEILLYIHIRHIFTIHISCKIANKFLTTIYYITAFGPLQMNCKSVSNLWDHVTENMLFRA